MFCKIIRKQCALIAHQMRPFGFKEAAAKGVPSIFLDLNGHGFMPS